MPIATVLCGGSIPTMMPGPFRLMNVLVPVVEKEFIALVNHVFREHTHLVVPIDLNDLRHDVVIRGMVIDEARLVAL